MSSNTNASRARHWVAFDVDGTLYDSSAVLVPAYEQAIAQFNERRPAHQRVALPTLADITALVGKPNWTILASLFPMLDEEERAALDGMVIAELSGLVRADHGRLYAGAVETLETLRAAGLGLMAVSNGRQSYLDAVFDCYALRPLFEPLRTLDSEGLSIKADLLQVYMDDLDISAKRLVMVGDRSSDLAAARAVGSRFVGCLFGYASEQELGGQEHTVRKLSELPELVSALLA